MAAATLPLIRGFPRGSAFVYREGRAVAVETFLGDVAKKTERLIRETASYAGLAQTTKAVMINETMLAKMRDSEASDTSKVINLLKSLQSTIKEKGAVEPYLMSIGERAELIRDQYQERQISSEQARQQLEVLAQEALAAEKAKKESGLPDDTFSIFWELKRHVYKDPKRLAIALTEPFRRFPHFQSNAEEMRQLKAELYKVLLPEVQGKKMVELVDRLIKLRSA